MEFKPEGIVGVERSLFNTLLDITGRPHFDVFSYRGRLIVSKLLDHARRLYDAEHGCHCLVTRGSRRILREVLLAEGYRLQETKMFPQCPSRK